uniref:Uncharacterized protein n=1 Tax=Bosea sp. NBC_00436 TaxID=2969620 RepID=A0A9E8CTF3_9HYPH
MDPACHLYHIGNSWSISVPVGEMWYGMNVWGVRTPGKTAKHYHRLADARMESVFRMHQGYTLEANDPSAFVLYARPRLVQETDTLGPVGSNRYLRDPRRLFFERLDRLRTLPLLTAEITRPAGTLNNVISDGLFDADFSRGLVTHWHCTDGSYLALASAGSNIINTNDELDDKYPVRFSSTVLLPFNRTTFDRVRLANGSHEGAYTEQGPQAWTGYGAAHYVKLPADW